MDWRGDLVISDDISRVTHNDLKDAGGEVTTILIEPDYGYDHGSPITHPLEVAKTINAFINQSLDSESAPDLLGAPVEYFDSSITFEFPQ